MGKTGKRPTKPKGNGKPASAKKPTPGCYVLSLTVENIRCFGPKQTLDCSDGEGRPRQWTVILGDNGTGKTTLLLTLACHTWSMEPDGHEGLGDPLAYRYASVLLRRTVTGGQGKCALAARMQPDLNSPDGEVRVAEWRIDTPHVLGYESSIDSIPLWAYGPNRGATATQSTGDDVVSRFLGTTSLNDAENLILSLDHASRIEKGVSQKALRGHVVSLLFNVLPGVGGMRVVTGSRFFPQPSVEFSTEYGWVPLRQLGHGYQTMIAWVVDFVSRLVERYPDSENPLAEPAVCLVDEIDLHLHPVWQRKVIGYLSERFPNTQFIVTAHSPLVVQAAASANANIAVLVRSTETDADGNHYIEIRNNPEDVRNWRLDQILTSDLFGGIDLRSAETAKLFARKRELLDKAKRTKPEEAELAEIEAKIAELPVGDSTKFSNDLQLLRDALDALKTTPQR